MTSASLPFPLAAFGFASSSRLIGSKSSPIISPSTPPAPLAVPVELAVLATRLRAPAVALPPGRDESVMPLRALMPLRILDRSSSSSYSANFLLSSE